MWVTWKPYILYLLMQIHFKMSWMSKIQIFKSWIPRAFVWFSSSHLLNLFDSCKKYVCVYVHKKPYTCNKFYPIVLEKAHLPMIISFYLITFKTWIYFYMQSHMKYNKHLWSHCKSYSSVQSLSRVRLFATPWIAACQASLSVTNFWSSLRLTSIESVMPSSHLILCCPLFFLLPIPPASESFPMSQLFPWGGQVLEFQL